MKNTDAKMEKLISNSTKFTRKHDYFTGLKVSEYIYLTQDMSGKDSLWDAIGNAYDIGFRRGYNRAKKDQAEKDQARN